MVGEEVTNDDGTIISEPTQEEVEGEHTYGLRYSEFISPMIKQLRIKADNDALRARIKRWRTHKMANTKIPSELITDDYNLSTSCR